MTSPRDSDLEIGQAAGFHDIVEAIPQATRLGPALAALALAEVRRGVMTGEGPTARGRIHFSRTIDAEDAALCESILIAAGGAAASPVTGAEIEVLFDIHDAAVDREDGGRFDELFVKAVAHHVLATGRGVPPRAVALAPATPLTDWVMPADFEVIDREIAARFAERVR